MAGDPDEVAARVAAAFRPPYGASTPGVDLASWRLIAGGVVGGLRVMASPRILYVRGQFGSAMVYSRLLVEGSATARGAGTVIEGRVVVRTPWWAVALYAVAIPLVAFVPLALGASPVLALAGGVLGAAIAANGIRVDQEHALDEAHVVTEFVRQAAAGRVPSAPVATWRSGSSTDEAGRGHH